MKVPTKRTESLVSVLGCDIYLGLCVALAKISLAMIPPSQLGRHLAQSAFKSKAMPVKDTEYFTHPEKSSLCPSTAVTSIHQLPPCPGFLACRHPPQSPIQRCRKLVPSTELTQHWSGRFSNYNESASQRELFFSLDAVRKARIIPFVLTHPHQ